MTPILFYGMEINATLENNNVVVHTKGSSTVPIKFSVEHEIGTDKYVNHKEVTITSDILKLRAMNDFNRNCVVVTIELNI